MSGNNDSFDDEPVEYEAISGLPLLKSERQPCVDDRWADAWPDQVDFANPDWLTRGSWSGAPYDRVLLDGIWWRDWTQWRLYSLIFPAKDDSGIWYGERGQVKFRVEGSVLARVPEASWAWTTENSPNTIELYGGWY